MNTKHQCQCSECQESAKALAEIHKHLLDPTASDALKLSLIRKQQAIRKARNARHIEQYPMRAVAAEVIAALNASQAKYGTPPIVIPEDFSDNFA